MGSRPQCNRFVTSMTDETAYGTAAADGAMTAMFSLVDPVLADTSQDITDDTDLLKGHEFRLDENAYDVLFNNRSIPMTNVPASAEFLAYLFASALGDVSTSQLDTSGDYEHTIKIMDVCSDGAQLPSRTIGLLYSGSSSLNMKYKGCVVDTLTLRATDRGRVTVDVTWVTDGTENDGSGISVPANFHSTSFYFGKDCDILEDVYGGTLASFKSILRGFELTINNNLDVDAAKNTNWQTSGALPKLEFGTREITCTLTLLGDETTAQYVHAAANDMMMSQFQLLGPTLAANDADCLIDFPRHIWQIGAKAFDGNERTFQLNYAMFFDATEASPIKVTVITADTTIL